MKILIVLLAILVVGTSVYPYQPRKVCPTKIKCSLYSKGKAIRYDEADTWRHTESVEIIHEGKGYKVDSLVYEIIYK